MLANLLKQLFARHSPAAEARPGTPQLQGAGRDGAWQLAQAIGMHRRGEYGALVEHCQAYLAGHPDDTQALQLLASALIARGERSAAISALQRAAALAPDTGEIHLTLARLLARTERIEDGLAAFRRAAELPRTAETAGGELAEVLNKLGRHDDAEHCARILLAQVPGAIRVQHELTRALFEQGRVDESIAGLRALVAGANVDPGIHSELLRALNFTDCVPAQAIFEEHRQWAERHARPLAPQSGVHEPARTPDKRLRIGFVSPYFRKHAVTFFLESTLEALDPAEIEVVLYSDVVHEDEYSSRLRSHGVLWRSTVALDDERMAALVRQDCIDILIDLSGHSPGNRLLVFARRPAPMQMSWNGYPNTTGMHAVDYRISDMYCDPPGMTEHLHTERLLRLPGVFMSWGAPTDAPDVAPSPCMRNGYITFASVNACYKLSTTTLALWSSILRQQPEARLMLLTVPPGIARQRIEAHFRNEGIDTARLQFRARVDHETFLAMHAQADICLDPFPYHGTTTTCFSLWMGVPVVTLAGSSPVSRMGVSLLSVIGMSELIAEDANEYIRIARELAQDPSRLASIRAGLRARMQASPLVDGRACAHALETRWRALWQERCEQAVTR